MESSQILTVGLGLEAPWVLEDQHLDTACRPTGWNLLSGPPPAFFGMRQRLPTS